MAALMEHVAFSSLSSEDELLGVTESNDVETVIVTCKTKGISIFKIDDQKPVKSWSVRRGLNLSNVTLWDRGQEEFVTVVHKQEYRHWKHETDDFEKGKRKTLGFKVHELLSVPEFDLVVVCETGTVDFLKTLKSSQCNQSQAQGQGKVIWCKACCLLNSLCVTCVIQSKSGSEIVIHKFSQNTDQWSVHRNPLTSPKEKSYIQGCACWADNSSASVHILWSCGIMQTWSISPEAELSTSVTQHSYSGIHGNSSIVAIGTTHVAVAGIKQDEEDGVAIFDTKFGSVQCWRPLPARILKKKAKLFCVRNHLFTANGKTLYSYRFNCEPSTLASVLGQQTNLESSAQPSAHYKWAAGPQEMIGKEKHIVGLFRKVLEPNINVHNFKTSFTALLDALKEDTSSHWSVSSHMIQLIQQCLAGTKYWPQQELSMLISEKLVPQRMIGDVVEALIQHKEAAVLHQLLSLTQDVPEKCMCQALEFYISCEDESLVRAVDNLQPKGRVNVTEESAPLGPYRTHFINHILSMQFSDAFMLECLRTVSFKHAVKLLEYLIHYFEVRSSKLEQETKDRQHLSALQVVEWLCLLLDAHMTQLVLSPDCHVLILNLHNIVTAQVQFYDEMVSLEALLEQLKVKSSHAVSQNKVGQYCIEVLHVP